MRCVGKRRIRPDCCCAMTVMSAITPIVWTLRCTLYPKAVGSANGERKTNYDALLFFLAVTGTRWK